jgi:hypothetical protein
MERRRANPQLIKVHRNYTVEQAGKTLGVHKNTVREWIKDGLPIIDEKRPHLILGRDLKDFLRERRRKKKRTCGIGELFCVRCRAPKFPAGNMADYVPDNETVGNLVAICPDCGFIMNRRVSKANLEQVCGKIDITFSQASRRLNEIDQPSVNSDFGKEGKI